MRLLLGLLCVLLATATMAQVPNTFQSGTTALAAEVNENFTNLDTRVSTNSTNIAQSLGGLILTQVPVSDGSGVAVALCPINSLVGSANCDCDSEGGIRNFGVLFACVVASDGGVAACFPEGVTFDPLLPSPLATVTIVCVSGVQNDGTPIIPTFSKGDPPVISKIADSGLELETAVNNARTRVADFTNALQNR